MRPKSPRVHYEKKETPKDSNEDKTPTAQPLIKKPILNSARKSELLKQKIRTI